MKYHRSRLLALKHNLNVPMYRWLAIAIMLVQSADVATTVIALHMPHNREGNPLFDMLIHWNAAVAYGGKIMIVAMLVTYILTLLHPRTALKLALLISSFAPLFNLLQIMWPM